MWQYLQHSATTEKPLTDEVTLIVATIQCSSGSWYSCGCSLTSRTHPSFVSVNLMPSFHQHLTIGMHLCPSIHGQSGLNLGHFEVRLILKLSIMFSMLLLSSFGGVVAHAVLLGDQYYLGILVPWGGCASVFWWMVSVTFLTTFSWIHSVIQGFLADYCEKISATLTDSLIGEY